MSPRARIAAIVFPGAALTVIGVYVAGKFGLDVPGEVAASITALANYGAYIFLGAGEGAKP